jgi:hypothetical protein
MEDCLEKLKFNVIILQAGKLRHGMLKGAAQHLALNSSLFFFTGMR